MDSQTIRKELEFNTGRFSEAAVRGAIEQRDAMSPVLLDVLREVAEAPTTIEQKSDFMLHFYAMYLLAQFREKAAYPLLVRFFSTPGEVSVDVTGDVVTEDLHRILASVCHNELAPLKRMIEDPGVNEYVRGACLRALVVLVAVRELPRDNVIAYFGGLFRGQLTREPDFIWGQLVSASCDLYPEELLPDIQQAYDDGLVDRLFIRMENVRHALSRGKEDVLQACRERRGRLIDDTVADMHWWACFDQSASSEAKSMVSNAPNLGVRSQPVVKGQKTGRNALCPCGSGKKYKTCCLH